ncbi:MAG: FliA/WhiG family RNA polymerase sigma factor [Acidobacteria bacterium]|nr:FliA/WhiG family RNA polymerase sigma factor [Acidobacteriota bacterium]
MASSQFAAYESEVASATSSRETLILEHLPLVRWIAHRIHERLPREFALDDLISTGILGLIAAIDSYDPIHNVKLSTFASYRIRGAIMDSIRGIDGIAPHHRKVVKQVQAAIAKLEQKLQRPPSEDEIAAELGMELEEYQQTLVQTRGVSIGSLDAAPVNTDKMTFLCFFADREDQEPGRILERAELKKVIAEGIARMPVAERQVLALYYQEGLNLKEIATIMNLHYSRISQLKTQAILRLKTLMDKKWPTPRGDI